jgi:hypothetical protein
MPDLVHVGSTTSAAIKDANKIQSISRWLVLAKPLPGTAGPNVGASTGRSRRDGSAAEAEATALPNAKAAALDRSLLLFKLLGNLHYWSPELPQQLQQRFVKLLVGVLRSSASSESEFTVACHRVTLNLQRLLKFLEPVSPDEDTADDEGDLLVNQLEIDLIADLRKSVAKLSMSAWRDALPGPTVSISAGCVRMLCGCICAHQAVVLLSRQRGYVSIATSCMVTAIGDSSKRVLLLTHTDCAALSLLFVFAAAAA